MNPTLLAGSVLALTTVSLSQSYVTSPPGYDYVEGRYSAHTTIGRYPGGRYMAFDGDYRGTSMTLKGIAYRLDNQMHTTATAMGRTWSNVQIHASECDTSSLNTTFSMNPITTPTLVFSAACTWPSHTGKPPTLPADWTVQFPFGTNWAYAGTKDICWDFVFTGGTLANSASWTASQSRYYYLDALEDPTYNEAKSSELGYSGNQLGCNDRGVTHLYGARVYTTARHYGNGPWNSTYRNNLVFYQNGDWFGISAQVITVLGLRSLETGFLFPGVNCNKLHIDLALPHMMFPFFSNTSGTLPKFTFGAPAAGIPIEPSWAGVELVTQAGWADTVNKSLLFSSAATLEIPTRPAYYERSILYSYDASAVKGSGPYWYYNYNPVARYTK